MHVFLFKSVFLCLLDHDGMEVAKGIENKIDFLLLKNMIECIRLNKECERKHHFIRHPLRVLQRPWQCQTWTHCPSTTPSLVWHHS